MTPITVFISWTCYGQWLHGDTRGSVDKTHNIVGEELLSPDLTRRSVEEERLSQPPYFMDASRRRLVLAAIREVCDHRSWTLHALHVRPTHVHVVVTGAQTPERMMNDFKSYASRALNSAGLDTEDKKRWTRHGSTRYLSDDSHLAAVVNY